MLVYDLQIRCACIVLFHLDFSKPQDVRGKKTVTWELKFFTYFFERAPLIFYFYYFYLIKSKESGIYSI